MHDLRTLTLLTVAILLLSHLSAHAQVATPVDAAQPTRPLTTVQFQNTSHDFGKIKEGKVVTYAYRYTNTGDAPLKIVHVKPSCGCTAPEWPKEDVAPGASGEVLIRFDSKGKAALQKKSVTVMFENTDPQNIVLTFTGEVKVKGKRK